ncbi:MAG: UvrD-helicase domain-containing protein [Bacteroidetes bacterium]|nr:UvrD-helicase domain-containing protein [Bacteroidota bacterium]
MERHDARHSAPSTPLSADFVNDLNAVQRDAATTIDGPVLIVAGAGSGKTRVLTYRIAYLLARGVRPWNILALTFTNKAAGEMKERIARLVGEERARPLWMGTFHSVFSRILRREATVLGYTSSFTIYDTDDSVSVVRSAMSEFGLSTADFSPKMIHSRISAAKNAMVNSTVYRNRAADQLEQKIAFVYESYERRLHASNAMDFDDLLVRTIDLFEKHPEVAAKYQNLFRHILIDEYQDTNRAQYTVVKMLAAVHRNICVVGDDSQSIYRFRGADIRNILDFEHDYPDYRIFRLEQNYRSTKTILAAADDVIKKNRQRIDKTLWTENDPGEKVRVITVRDEREEGEEIVRLIQQEQRAGRLLNDIAILYRINSQSLSVEDALRRVNIPYGLVGGVAFYRRKEVKDALAYLRLVVNERDDESFLRAVNTPARGVGETSLKRLRLAAQGRNMSLLQSARHPEQIPDLTPRVGTVLGKFAEMIDLYRNHLGDMSPAELASTLLSESGLLRSYKDEGTPEAVARWDNVQRILSHIAEYGELNPEATLDVYLQEIALVADADSYDAAADRVTLMTIHSAKGLEFKVVIVAGMEEGLFPVGNAAQDQDDLEEERRLFYVAVTRAKEKLYLTNAERRYRFGELSYPTPSRFLNEIRDELLEFDSTAPPRPSASSFGFGSGGRAQRGGFSTRRAGSTPPATESQIAPQEFADDYSQTPKTLQVGSHVQHPTFGPGRIEAIVGRGDATKITVRFESVGKKQLMLKFANLRLL